MANPEPDTALKNEAIIRRLFGGINDHDVAIFALFAEHVLHHNRLPGTEAGREGNRQGMLRMWAAFPDYRVTLHDVVAMTDRVAVRMLIEGTHEGTLNGIAGTRTHVAFEAMAFFRLEDGQIVEEWLVSDQLGLQQQLGVNIRHRRSRTHVQAARSKGGN